MKYAVNEAGVSALQNISTALMNSVADLFEKTSQLQTITSDNEDSLGPHKASLNQAIMEIYIGLKESTESISTLAASAKDIAEAYQEIIDNDDHCVEFCRDHGAEVLFSLHRSCSFL